ncbi:MAG TPA: TonB C-terminal domain-containing protein [Candidatus Polarisedimenticolia bacterium]|nr:TonB C-terminal domain-containing protein [Candidatus Polarisedimenticolia bacterium]
MEMLSLNEPPEVPARGLSRAEGIGASIVVHLLLLLLFLRGLEGLPEPIARFLREHAPTPPPEVAAAPAAPVPAPSSSVKKPAEKEKIPPIPLKFAYVRVPEEAQPQKNPNASLLSDRDRKARQEMPTPPDAKQFTRDPHAKGDSRDRVRPDPRIKEGREMPEPPRPESQTKVAEDRLASESDKEGGAPSDPAKPGQEQEEKIAENTAGHPTDRLPGPSGQALPGSPGGGRQPGGQGGAGSGPGRGGPPVFNPNGGTEEKFHFDNPGWLRGEAVTGTLSFDTKGLPWGDYARKIYVIIRQNWIDRLPLAYRNGQRGVTCQHFVIEKDGTISVIDIVRPSDVPPFDRAASDALKASSALPPLPPDFNLEKEGVTGCFWYNLYPSDD